VTRSFNLARLCPLTMFALTAATVWPLASAVAQSGPVPTMPAPNMPAPSIAAPAANINITPRRVIFDAAKRTEAVYVFNQGGAPVTVDVGLVDNVMLATGEISPLSEIAKKGPTAQATAARMHSAHDLILATPSRLTLLPGKGKTIRIRASLPEGAAENGEWRTHLAVTTVPPPETGLTAEAAASTKTGELAIRIQTVFGVSIPLIVRSGAASATATIGSIGLEHGDAPSPDGTKSRRVAILTFPLSRTGASSIYGNIVARIDANNGREVVGFIRGIAVYPELDLRRVSMALTRELHRGETVTVTFFSDDNQLRGVQASGHFIAP
jgi:hypothetical protein